MPYQGGGCSTRDRILAEALNLFSTRGYRGTRVQDIEEAAGLSPGAGGFYRHFRSKREVLETALEHYAEQATYSETTPRPTTSRRLPVRAHAPLQVGSQHDGHTERLHPDPP